MSRSHRLFAAVLALAAVLRLARAATRWEEWAWRYSAYPSPVVDALEGGDPLTAATTFTGLHPPLWSTLYALTEIVLPVPALWLLAGASFGLGAVALVARRDWVAGLLLATAPVQLHYTAEVNDYPLLMLLVAGIWVAREQTIDGKGHWAWVAALGALAGWTHALGGLVAAVAVLSLPRRSALKGLAVLAAAAAPLVPALFALLGDDATFRQPPFVWSLVVGDLWTRFGPGGLAALPFAIMGARHAKGLAAGVAVPILALAALIALGIAAPHQFPYLVVLGAPVALLAARGATPRWARGALVALALAQGAWVGAHEARAWLDIQTDPHDRAIDLALKELDEPWTCAKDTPVTPDCAGDALVLLAGGGGNDDDKWRSSPVLWRISPWTALPRLRGGPGDWADHRRGHPRQYRGHAVYVFEHVRDELADTLRVHPAAWVVVYGDGPRVRFLDELRAMTGQDATRIGPDHLLRVAQGVGIP